MKGQFFVCVWGAATGFWKTGFKGLWGSGPVPAGAPGPGPASGLAAWRPAGSLGAEGRGQAWGQRVRRGEWGRAPRRHRKTALDEARGPPGGRRRVSARAAPRLVLAQQPARPATSGPGFVRGTFVSCFWGVGRVHRGLHSFGRGWRGWARPLPGSKAARRARGVGLGWALGRAARRRRYGKVGSSGGQWVGKMTAQGPHGLMQWMRGGETGSMAHRTGRGCGGNRGQARATGSHNGAHARERL